MGDLDGEFPASLFGYSVRSAYDHWPYAASVDLLRVGKSSCFTLLPHRVNLRSRFLLFFVILDSYLDFNFFFPINQIKLWNGLSQLCLRA
jgi:hypothetical protein